MNNIPEIVAPWWSHSKAIVASLNWAEAIYLWVPFTSLRMRQNKVNTFEELKTTINELHNNWSKAYLTMNIFPRNIDIKVFESVVEKISDIWADAIIFSDPWTYNIIRRYIPNIQLHLSTQTNILNSEAVKFWYNLWVKRIVLARELNLKEIQQIKKDIPGIELEVFVHWAMCMTYSWRCLLWEYFSWRDWNKWECSHVCRYKYKVYLEEEKRPWKLFQLESDEDGSYILSSKDLCTIERLWELLPFVDGLKIEWRSKSEFYVWATVKAYTHVRDCIINWNNIDNNIKNLVYEIPHRYYWDWFLFNSIKKEAPHTEESYTEYDLSKINSNDQNWLVENNLWCFSEDPTIFSSITKTTAWPIQNRKYMWLVYPNSIEKDGKKYFKFVSKDNINIGDILNYLSPSWLWKVKVIWLLDKSENSISIAHCNYEFSYVSFDIDFCWWECLYV